MSTPASSAASIRVGVGGWTFAPWRDNFYPPGWPQQRELEYASRHLRVIEINGTFYSLQKPSTFAKWRDETPDDFIFSVKASRLSTHRRVLAEGAETVRRFIDSGLAELGPKLGPIVWQFAPTKRFEAEDFSAFLQMLPAEVGGVPLRHAIEVRHASFQCPEYLALARARRVATVFTDSADYPSFADLTGDFVYVRTMRTDPSLPEGCAPEALDALASCARAWQSGSEPAGVPRIQVAAPDASPSSGRDVFIFFISSAKEKNPTAAMALQSRVDAMASG